MLIRKILLSSTFALLLCAELPAPAMAASVGNAVWLVPPAPDAVMTEVQRRGRGGAVRRSTVVRRPGGTVVRRSTVVRPGYRPGVRPGYGWRRPAYRWGPGGAIAAGAALGFVGAATAAAWAGSAPAPGMCWYYTNSSRRSGFWDYCP
jgi:hypothetical protein